MKIEMNSPPPHRSPPRCRGLPPPAACRRECPSICPSWLRLFLRLVPLRRRFLRAPEARDDQEKGCHADAGVGNIKGRPVAMARRNQPAVEGQLEVQRVVALKFRQRHSPEGPFSIPQGERQSVCCILYSTEYKATEIVSFLPGFDYSSSNPANSLDAWVDETLIANEYNLKGSDIISNPQQREITNLPVFVA